jgi:hypothetical protein
MSEDITTFTTALLATDPKPPGSIQLEIDTDGLTGLYEVLLTIMTDVLKTWYPPPIQLSSLTTADHAKLAAYFASFGYRFHLEITDVPRVFRPTNRDYITQSRLPDMKFQMTNNGNLYTASFDFLNSRP